MMAAMRYWLAGAMLVAASAAVHAATGATPSTHAPAPPQQEDLNCNDPGVSKGPGSWAPRRQQLQAADQKLANAFPPEAAKANLPKANYGLLHCGIHEGSALVIVVNGARKANGKFVCDDPANFAVTYNPGDQTFGAFHFAVSLCRPETAAPPNKK
jgi:hypothetical protein